MNRFAVLGPVECWSLMTPVEIRGSLQRTLLAVLLAGESRPVAAESVAAELWAGEPPRNWENALQAHVSRLRRRLLEQTGDGSARLLIQSGEYRLDVDASTVDAMIFMRKFTHAKVLASSDTAAAIGAFRSALSLWRGPAFGNVMGGPLCRSAAARYEAARISALETMFDLELRAGRHVDIIPTLSELVELMLNERFCEQLMVALYRAGRQTEALGSYRRLRQRLDLELGVQPTRTLRNHEKAILTHDSSLSINANHLVLRD